MNEYRVPIPDISFNPPVYHCKRAKKPFVLDGNIFKEFWEEAPFTELFSDIQGEGQPKPARDTKAKMLWDDENLYIGAVLYGEEIWATLTERDCVIFQDNDFEIFIDPDSDTHGYFEFEMNALNTVWDLFLTKPYRDRGGKPLNGWDIKGLRSQVSIQGSLNTVDPSNKSWMVEVVIPFKALTEMSQSKENPVPGEYYRVNYSRVQWHTDTSTGEYVKKDLPEENWVWSPTGVINIHYPELWGFVFFAEGEEKYSIPDKEFIKWELRQWYYLMHKHFDDEGYFTKDVNQLSTKPEGLKEPKIEATKNTFVLSMNNNTTGEKVVLYDDGKVEVVDFETCEKKLRKLPLKVKKTLNKIELECMEFLYEYMPLSDLVDYSPELFLQFVRHSLKVKGLMSWGNKIAKNHFLNYVLQFRINNEHIEFYSQYFYDELAPRIEGLSLKEAIIEINYWCFEKATYKATNARTAAPFTTLKNAFARCGEESTFVVAALRSVGIPARQCYAPRWSHCDDNHAWVEVWTEDGWQYLGACEPEMDLNRGWFRLPASKAMLVHNRVLSDKVTHEEITTQTPRMTEINVLDHYAQTKKVTVHVVDEKGLSVEGVTVRFEVVNYCEFYPITSLMTDKTGLVQFVTGLGDLMIYIYMGERFAYKKVDIRNEDSIQLVLPEKGNMEREIENYVFIPPIGGVQSETVLTKRQNEEHELRTQKAVKIRNDYEATFYTNENWMEKLDGFEIFKEQVALCLIRSRGNHHEIISFLLGSLKDELSWKIKMLQVLPQKDLSDSTKEELLDHFKVAYKFRDDFEEEMFINYVMSPRIWIEKIRRYRKKIECFFDETTKEGFRNQPSKIQDWLNVHIRQYDDKEYSNLNTSPFGVLKSGCGNRISIKILFVAIARTLGIPAMIKKDNGDIAYYHLNKWSHIKECTLHENKKMGVLKLIKNKDESFEYYQQFTLAKKVEGYYQTLDYEGISCSEDNIVLPIEIGEYRLITANRSMDESNYVRVEKFNVSEGEEIELRLKLNEVVTKKVEIPLDKKLGETTAPKSIICWLGLGEEPTEHLLNELIEMKAQFEKVSHQLYLVIPEESGRKNPTFKKVCESIPTLQVLIDDQYEIETYYKGLGIDEKRLPLAMVAEKKIVNYGVSGYQVGIGQLLIKATS